MIPPVIPLQKGNPVKDIIHLSPPHAFGNPPAWVRHEKAGMSPPVIPLQEGNPVKDIIHVSPPHASGYPPAWLRHEKVDMIEVWFGVCVSKRSVKKVYIGCILMIYSVYYTVRIYTYHECSPDT